MEQCLSSVTNLNAVNSFSQSFVKHVCQLTKVDVTLAMNISALGLTLSSFLHGLGANLYFHLLNKTFQGHFSQDR